jgi:hypothetical protein
MLMYPSKATCLPLDYFQLGGTAQIRYQCHLNELTCSRHDIAEKLFIWR